MARQPFALTPEAYPRSLEVVGEQITVLASNEVTSGYEILSGPLLNTPGKLVEIGAQHRLVVAG